MAHRETVVQAFIASPSDVAEEREALEEVVDEINATWARDQGMRLELIKWETDVRPGVADDAQQVVNDQIGEGYDLFIGVMWHRMCTQTGRNDSGTIEEFEKALERFHNDRESVEIMFYFKTAAVPLDEVDPDQLKGVKSFKSRISDEGVLYWEFSDVENFKALTRIHLSRCMQKWRDQRGPLADEYSSTSTPSERPSSLSSARLIVEAEEEGLDITSIGDIGWLDLLEQTQITTEGSIESMREITEATSELSGRMRQKTKVIKQFEKSPNPTPAKLKALVNKSANDLDSFTRRIHPHVIVFDDQIRKMINSISLLMLYTDEMSDDLELKEMVTLVTQAEQLLTNVGQMKASASSSVEEVRGFRNAIASLPRLTTKLNRAKKATVETLELFIESTARISTLAGETELVISHSLNRMKRSLGIHAN